MTGGRDETHQPSWERRLSLPAYRYGEAARLAQATWQAVARWQREYDRSANQRDTIALRRPKLLSYLQLIEVAVVAQFRRAGGRFADLRWMHDYLGKKLQSEYPLATLKFKTDGARLLAAADGFSAAKSLPLAMTMRNGRSVWADAIQQRFEQFEYERGLALRWYPRGRGGGILVDPRIAFGAPVIAETGVPTQIVRERYEAGEELRDIEADFAVSRQQIEAALEFERMRHIRVA